MLIFFKERLVFLSVPKTGTTAYESALRDRADIVFSAPPELKHMPLYRYNRFMRPMFEKVVNARLDAIAVVRQPVDWLGSWYRYRRRAGFEGHRNSTHHIDFDQFVEAYLRDERPPFANVGNQAKFLAPRANGLKVSRLFRYESTARLDAFLTERLNHPVDTRRENVSPKMDLSLSPAIEARLQDTCRDQFDLYETAE